jgi:signal transduction histidine kinase
MIHELKSPLAVIASNCGVSTMLIQRGRADEKTVKGLKLAESEAVRLGNLIDRTSKVSFAEGTAVSVKQESVGGLLQDARLFCEPICQKNRNRMEVLCGENDTVYCDRDLILQVLYNLIINANRHTENSTILLVGKTDPDKTVITVSDHGDGIMPDMREKVFERGYSGDGSTGYGLSICRTIMDMHHGDIATLDNEGGGTVVEITIYNERDKGDSNATDTAD